MDGAPPRRTAGAFPAYAYVPRRMPHPVTDPRGHSYGVRDQAVVLGERRLPRDWARVEQYLYGVDLFNAAFFWEAHESWEAVWHAVERDSVVGRFLQGLIQSSAALLQHHCGRRIGSKNLFERSRSNLEPAREWLAARHRSDFMGVALEPWQGVVAAYVSGDRAPAADAPFPFLVLALD